MSREVIAIDIDDVLADGAASLRPQIRQLTGVDVHHEHYHSAPGQYGEVYEATWQRLGLGISFRDLSTDMTKDQGHMLPIKNAVPSLQGLSKRHDLIVVTARLPSWREPTARWVQQHFEGLFREVFFTESEIGDKKTKGQICVEQGASHLVDDNIEYCNSAAELDVTGVIFGQYAWNTQAVPEDLIRCRDWDEVKGYFDGRS